MLGRLEDIEAAHGGRLPARINQKPHLLFPWLNELVRHPRILDAVEDVLGPDLLCWGSQFFAKNARRPELRVVAPGRAPTGACRRPTSSPPGSRSRRARSRAAACGSCPAPSTRQVPHKDTFAETNLLSRGQEIEVDVDENDAVDVILRPGEMSLHHVLICHGSEPNRADHRARRLRHPLHRRPSVYQTSGVRESAHPGARQSTRTTTSTTSCRPRPTCIRTRWRATPRSSRRQLTDPLRGRRPAGQARRRRARPRNERRGRRRRRRHPTSQETSMRSALARPVAGRRAARRLPPSAQDVIRIRFAHSLSTTEPAHLAAEFFAKNVAAAHQQQGADPGLPERAARLRQGGQRDDPPGRERDEHHRPRLPVRLRARHRRAQRPLPDQGPERLRTSCSPPTGTRASRRSSRPPASSWSWPTASSASAT